MATSDVINRIYSHIVMGKTKEETTVTLDPELDALWDQIAQEVQEIKDNNPGAVFDIPNEIPDVDPRF